MRSQSYTVETHFVGRTPSVRGVYDRLLTAARKLGPVVEEPKKTSIHLSNKTAFAGVATRKECLVLTLKSARDIRSARITRHERVSANRWHLELKLSDPREVDAELTGWLRKAYVLSV
jgi:uncharacterized protein DUF5655